MTTSSCVKRTARLFSAMRGNLDSSASTMAGRPRDGGTSARRKFTLRSSQRPRCGSSSGATRARRLRPCFSCKKGFRGSATGWRMKFSGGQGSHRKCLRERYAKKSSTRFGERHDLWPGRHSGQLVEIIPIRQKTGCYTCDGKRAENAHATARHCGALESAGAPRCGVRSVNTDRKLHSKRTPGALRAKYGGVLRA